MRNIKLVLEYEGTEYSGFQIQKDQPTVQEELETALQTLTREDIRVICAGRTDSGVHALGQVVNFRTESSIPTEKFVPALNTTLPRDIRIRSSEEEAADFHSQLDAVGKVYQYTFLCDPQGSVFLRRYSHWLRRPPALEPMQQACRHLEGEHNFSSFRSAGCQAQSPVKKIYSCTCYRRRNLIHLRVEGSGFLYKMMRIISGTLLDVGWGKLNPLDVKRIMEACDRKLAGPTLPACGLCLIRVDYN